MTDLHLLNKLVHATSGVFAVSLGLVPLFTRKGSRVHRIGGWLFTAFGAVVLACAVIGDLAYPQPGPLLAVTLSAAYQYVSGLRALPRTAGALNAIDALLALATLFLAAALAPRMSHGDISWPPVIGYVSLAYVCVIAVYDLSRHAWRNVWRRHARPVDHGLKMAGAWIAMVSAGSGNLLRDLHPWSQYGPTAIGPLLVAAIVIRYLSRGRQPAVAMKDLTPDYARYPD